MAYRHPLRASPLKTGRLTLLTICLRSKRSEVRILSGVPDISEGNHCKHGVWRCCCAEFLRLQVRPTWATVVAASWPRLVHKRNVDFFSTLSHIAYSEFAKRSVFPDYSAMCRCRNQVELLAGIATAGGAGQTASRTGRGFSQRISFGVKGGALSRLPSSWIISAK